jgi:hypothetical protein
MSDFGDYCAENPKAKILKVVVKNKKSFIFVFEKLKGIILWAYSSTMATKHFP